VDVSGEQSLDVEILAEPPHREDLLQEQKVRRLCALAAASAGVHMGHLAIALVGEERIAELNAAHCGKTGPTDVLSFPIDGAVSLDGVPRELGDVVICPQHTRDLHEAVLHGALHLVGMDHERDAGEMLALQAELMRWEALGRDPTAGSA
jgi:probable rRNA maturation factor